MPSATEYLRLIIDADGKGAVRGLEKVGSVADRQLGIADDRLKRVGAQLTTFGAATVAGAAVAGAGLYKVAQSASAYGEQVSRAVKTFGDTAVPGLEEFAAAAAETAGISKTAALQTANEYAALGKQAGLSGDDIAEFSTTLVQSAGDLASFADVPIEEAIVAIGAALRGESEPISRFGIDTKEAAIQAEALRVGIISTDRALTNQEKVLARQSVLMREGALFAGDFVDTSDSLGNSQKKLAADFENAKVALGQGLLPLATDALGVVTDLTDRFTALSPAQQSAIGKFAGIGVTAAGAVGGLSLLAGQTIKLREAFTTVSGSGADATRSLTTLGKVAGGAAGVATALVVWNELDDALTNVSQSSVDLATNMDLLRSAATPEDALGLLVERSKELDGTWENVKESATKLLVPIQTLRGPMENLGIDINGTTVDLNDLRDALDDLAEGQEWDSLRLALQGLEQGVADGTISAKLANPVIEQYRDRLEAAGQAARASAAGNRAAAAGFGVLKPAVEDATEVIDENTDSFLGAIKAQRSYADAQRDLSDAYKELRDLQNRKFSAEDEAAGLRAIEDAARGVEDAYRSLEDAQRSVEDARRDLARSEEDLIEGLKDLEGVTVGTVEFDEGSDKVRDLARSREDAQRGLDDALRAEQDAQRGVADAVRDKGDAQRELTQARADAKPTAEELEEAVRKVDEANLAVVESGLKEAAALQGVQGSSDDAKAALLELAKDAPPEVQAAVELMIAQLDLLDTRLDKSSGKYIDLAQAFSDKSAGFAGATSSGSAPVDKPRRHAPEIRIFRRAQGGDVSAGEPYSVNEFGGELFSPDTDGFVINSGDTNRLISGLEQLVQGGGKGAGTYNITVPVLQAPSGEDIVRAMRTEEFLYAGVG